MKGLIYIWIILCLLFHHSLMSQEPIENSKSLDQESYQDLVDKLDYSKTKKALKLRKKKSNWDLSDEKKKKEKKAFSFRALGNAMSVFAYAVIIILVALLLYFIFSNIKVDKKIDAEVQPEDEEDEIENIDNLDVVGKYNEALQSGDYRSAIRWRFLHALQLLSLKEIIIWKPEKTNRDYNREIENISDKNDFRQLARYYEYVWYGNSIIDQNTFDRLDVQFEKFIKTKDVK